MQRINHDLAGITQRIAKLGDEFEFSLGEIAEIWKDDVGRSFLQQNTSNVGPQLNQLVSELSVAIEDFENIAKQLQDPDRY
ncbi:MAG: hypothetical protein U0930_13015 [Pirellulales bacterium]